MEPVTKPESWLNTMTVRRKRQKKALRSVIICIPDKPLDTEDHLTKQKASKLQDRHSRRAFVGLRLQESERQKDACQECPVKMGK